MKDEYCKLSSTSVMQKFEIQQLKGSLTREKHRSKRKRKVLEHLRSDGGAAALFMNSSEVQRVRELQLEREQELEQLQQDKLARKEAVTQRKVDKELEQQRKREERAVATEARKAAAAEKKASSEATKLARGAQKSLNLLPKQLERSLRHPERPRRLLLGLNPSL